MKKLIIIITATLAIIGLYIFWRNLPLTINRSTDIKLGNEIIGKIETYKKDNGQLPDDTDWRTLKKFGFRNKIDFLQPEYSKLNNETFELIYIEGFDGPYLIWNSKERKWKMGNPVITKEKNEAKSGI